MDRTGLGITVTAILFFCGYLLTSPVDARLKNSSDASILLSQTTSVPEVVVETSASSSAPLSATRVAFPPKPVVVAPPAIRVPRVTPAPRPRLAVTTARRPQARRKPRRPAYHEIEALVTAYCPCRRCCGRHANGRTSTGTSAWNRGAATDPRAIPYGTKIYVEGYGFTTVDDTGGAMRHRRRRGLSPQIDLRMDYHWQARRWGRRYLRIRIYDR